MDKIRQCLYYFLIGTISLIALCFLPFLGSEVGLNWNVPGTTAGWIVWASTKVIISTLNVLIFHCFMQQGQLNVINDERYKKALDILLKQKEKGHDPKSPSKFLGNEYGKKGVFIFLFTALGTIALTQAILTFDWVSLITYIFTIIMGIVFGILQMKKAEWYWTEEFLRYAEWKQTRKKEEENK